MKKLLACILFVLSCDPDDIDNSDCKEAGKTRCNGSKIEIIDPYCRWDIEGDCNDVGMVCCVTDYDRLPTCLAKCEE